MTDLQQRIDYMRQSISSSKPTTKRNINVGTWFREQGVALGRTIKADQNFWIDASVAVKHLRQREAMSDFEIRQFFQWVWRVLYPRLKRQFQSERLRTPLDSLRFVWQYRQWCESYSTMLGNGDFDGAVADSLQQAS